MKCRHPDRITSLVESIKLQNGEIVTPKPTSPILVTQCNDCGYTVLKQVM